MMRAVFSRPRLLIVSELCFHRSSSNSTPVASAWNFLRGHDDDPAVAAAQVEHLLARLQAAELQHLLDDGLGRRVVRRQLLDLCLLLLPHEAEEGQNRKHQQTLQTIVGLSRLKINSDPIALLAAGLDGELGRPGIDHRRQADLHQVDSRRTLAREWRA